MSAPRNLLDVWATLLMEAIAGAGVRECVLSPGSRSTPLVLAATALAERGLLRIIDVIDERAAGFHALGIARTTSRPVLLVCTSGTAAAHYLPAVIEAGQAHVPLVVLSADRPFELSACGAPQTIDQVKLFGDHARAFFELGLPDDSDGALRAVRRVAVQAVATTRSPLPGAVHLNFRARKPLEPPPRDAWTAEEVALSARATALGATPLPRVFLPRLTPHDDALDELAAACAGARRGVLIAGPAPIRQAEARGAIGALARAAGLPLYAEAASQLRFTGEPVEATAPHIDALDALLRIEAVREALAPDLVLQLGAPVTSASVEGWAAGPAPRWVIAPHGMNDPSSSAFAHVRAEVAAVCGALAERLSTLRAAAASRAPWLGQLAALQAMAAHEIDAAIDEEGGGFSEALAVRTAVSRVPAGSVLALGNSLPIREVDGLCRGAAARCLVWSQRGANGIDGVIAGAAGAARCGLATTLLIGDVAALHDAAGLACAAGLEAPLVVVLLHNGGGRIFEQLPLAARPDLAAHLDHFTTPHRTSFEPAARLHGHRFVAVADRAALAGAIDHAHRQRGCTVIEVSLPADSAAQMARRIDGRLRAALSARPGLLHQGA